MNPKKKVFVWRHQKEGRSLEVKFRKMNFILKSKLKESSDNFKLLWKVLFISTILIFSIGSLQTKPKKKRKEKKRKWDYWVNHNRHCLCH